MNVGKNATIKDVINATNWLLVTVEINNPRKSEININTDDIIKSQKTEPLNGTSNNKIPAITVKAMEIIPKTLAEKGFLFLRRHLLELFTVNHKQYYKREGHGIRYGLKSPEPLDYLIAQHEILSQALERIIIPGSPGRLFCRRVSAGNENNHACAAPAI